MSDGNGFSFFARFKSFIEHGWLGILPKIESDIWLVYLHAADRATGIAYPGNDRIRRLIRHDSTGHIRGGRANLVRRGLLECLQPGSGGGRGVESGHYFIPIPPVPSPANASRFGTRPDLERVPIRGATRSVLGRNAFRNGTQHNKEEQPITSPLPSHAAHDASASSEWAFKVRGKGEWKLPADLLAKLRHAHPHLDLDAELVKAQVWCAESPAKRKTARGMGRFILGWMGRAANGNGKHAPADEPAGISDEALASIPYDPLQNEFDAKARAKGALK